ncbi:Odorant receptor 37 [Blattella germanica]|nr:Odorant receptor 37 [Blattella germanica]
MPKSNTIETFEDIKKKSLHSNMESLQRIGIIQSPSTKKNPLKKMICNLLTAFTFLIGIPTLIGQILALFHFWDNLFILFSGLFNFVALVLCYILGVHGVIMKDDIMQLFVTFKDELLIKTENVGIKEKTREIFAETSKKAHHMTMYILTILVTLMVLWAPVPFYTHYTEDRNATRSAEEDEARWLHFCFLIWFPVDIRVTPFYEIMYLSQCLIFYVNLSHIHSVGITMASFIVHIGGQFEILSKAIEDMDTFLETTDIQDKMQRNQTMMRKTMKEHAKHSPPHFHIKTGVPKDLNENIHALSIYGSDGDKLEFILDYPEQREYILNIVNLHQAVIEFSREVNRVAGPVILALLFICQFLTCLMIFLLTLEWKQGTRKAENFARYAIAGLCAISFSFELCWHGENAKQSSRRLADAIYESQWYRHTVTFNRDLFMIKELAQKEVTFSGGNFYVLSLETFGEMMNTMYTLYTLLQNAYEG